MKTTQRLISWKNYVFYLHSASFVNNSLLKVAIQNFWDNPIKDLHKNQIHLILRFKLSNNLVRTIGSLNTVNNTKSDMLAYQDHIIELYNLLQDGYTDYSITEIIFSYGIVEGKGKPFVKPIKSDVANLNYSHYQLPIVSPYDDQTKYGNIISLTDQSKGSLINKTYVIQTKNNRVFTIHTTGNKDGLISEISYYYNSIKSLSYTDSALNGGSHFIRSIGSREYKFSNFGELILMTQEKKVNKYITSAKTDQDNNINYITADLETYQSGSDLIPYLACIYTGENYFTSHLSGFNSSNDLINDFITNLINIARENRDIILSNYELKKELSLNKENSNDSVKEFTKPDTNLYVYLHNLANFDIFFIFENLINYNENNKIKCIVNNGKFISIKYTHFFNSTDKVNIIFYDSIQLLPSSLGNLSKFFNKADEHKLTFDHSKVNSNNLSVMK